MMMLVLKASATLLISSLSQVKRAKWEQSVIHTTSNEEANKSADGDSRKSDINADTRGDDNSDDNMNILEMSQF